MRVFKDGRKTYLVMKYDPDWIDVQYEIEANKHFKVKASDLTVRKGYVMDGVDLYWELGDTPAHKYKSFEEVRVAYKK